MGWAWPQAPGLECRHLRNRANAVPWPGPESGRKSPPLSSSSLPLGLLSLFLDSRAAGMLGSRPGPRGARIPAGGVLENTRPLSCRMRSCRVLAPLKKKETGHRVCALPSGRLQNNSISRNNNWDLRGALCGKLGHLAPFFPSRLPPRHCPVAQQLVTLN